MLTVHQQGRLKSCLRWKVFTFLSKIRFTLFYCYARLNGDTLLQLQQMCTSFIVPGAKEKRKTLQKQLLLPSKLPVFLHQLGTSKDWRFLTIVLCKIAQGLIAWLIVSTDSPTWDLKIWASSRVISLGYWSWWIWSCVMMFSFCEMLKARDTVF